MPEISIIVPVYKVESYLHSCINSILLQTFEDFELILVDDGSPDNCGAICDEYAAKDQRVRVIHKENGGLASARNAGLDSARGAYICFVDSDDWIARDYCDSLYKILVNSNCAFSVCGVCRFDEESECQVDSSLMKACIVDNITFFRMQLAKKSEFGAVNKLYRRELFERIRFAEGKIHEDVIWSGDLARRLNGGVVVTDKQLYYYRQRSGSIVHAGKCSADRIYAGQCLIDTAEQVCPELFDECLRYAAEYPFMFVDGIYVRREFKENKAFLDALQALLRRYPKEYAAHSSLSSIQRKRMRLFAKSRFLYGLNAYARLMRVYLYRVLGKDAYADGHGI